MLVKMSFKVATFLSGIGYECHVRIKSFCFYLNLKKAAKRIRISVVSGKIC